MRAAGSTCSTTSPAPARSAMLLADAARAVDDRAGAAVRRAPRAARPEQPLARAPARCATPRHPPRAHAPRCSTIRCSTSRSSARTKAAYLSGPARSGDRTCRGADRAGRRGARGGDRDGRPRRRPQRRAHAGAPGPTATATPLVAEHLAARIGEAEPVAEEELHRLLHPARAAEHRAYWRRDATQPGAEDGPRRRRDRAVGGAAARAARSGGGGAALLGLPSDATRSPSRRSRGAPTA